MKAPAVFAFAAMAAGALAQSCNEGQTYCGWWLIDWKDWSYRDLVDAVDRGSGLPRWARNDPENVLFVCVEDGYEIEAIDYCYNSCDTSGPEGEHDFCRNSAWRLFRQGEKQTDI